MMGRLKSAVCGWLLVAMTLGLLMGTGSTRAAQGGPDAFGYLWTDSNPPAPTVPYNWVDIVPSGTLVVWAGGGDDEFIGPFALGFSFTYYGLPYTDVYISTNGYLTFGAGDATIPGGSPIPNPATPNNALMAFGADLFPGGAVSPDGVYYEAQPNRFVVEYSNVPFCCPGPIQTFEIILEDTGAIWFQYQSVTAPPAQVGIENAAGSAGLDYGVAVADNLAVQFTLVASPPVAPDWFDDMELGPSPWWDASTGGIDEWQWGTPSIVGPPSCFSGTACWGTDLSGTYDVGFDASLYPPPFDLTAATQVDLTFMHWFAIYGDTPPNSQDDGGFLEVSTDGGVSWNQLFPTSGLLYQETMDFGGPYPGGPVFGQQSGAWVQSTVDLTPFVGLTIRIRFRLWDDTSVGPNTAGWYIDDVRLDQLSVDLLPDTVSGSGAAGSTLSYPFTVDNLQTFSDTFDLTATGVLGWTVQFWDAPNTAPLTDTAGTAAPDTGVVAASGTFFFTVRVLIPGGANPCDFETSTITATSVTNGETDISTVGSSVVCSVPFLDTFDPSPRPGWVLGDNGAGTVWEWGAPPFGPGSCSSPPACYGTNLNTGSYTNGVVADLITPPVSLPPAATITLEFRHWYQTETCCDPATVWASPDGAAWTWLGQYQGTSGGWQSAQFDLSAFTGGPVYVRFRLTTDGSVIGAGWYVDDVNLFVPALELLPDNVGATGTRGTAVAYPFSVTNLQAIPDTFDLTATGVLGWTVEFWNAADTALLTDTAGAPAPDTGSVGPGATFNFNVHVLIPGAANPGDVETSTITATSVGIPVDFDVSFATTTVVAALDLFPNAVANAGPAGTTMVYPFWVSNLQAVPDTFDLTATGVLGWTVEFWNAADTALLTDTAGSAAPDTGVVPAFGAFNFNVHVLIPGAANPGDVETSTITATSVGNGLNTDISSISTMAIPPPVAPPWFDDMELGPSPWTSASTGGIDEWQWGTPTFGPPSCASGAACWGTDLSGTYDVGFDASLYPPAFDLTSSVAPELTFTHWFAIYGDAPPNSQDDGGFLEVSTDGGVSWNQLFPTSGLPYQETMDFGGPYPGDPVFGQQSGGWVQSTVDLTPFLGGIIQVRFRLWDDVFVGPNTAGWYIDDVRLLEPALLLLPSNAANGGTVGTPVAYPFSVTNLQAIPDTFDLTATGVLGWTVEFWNAADTALLTDTAGAPAPDTGSVGPGATFNFNVHVLIPGAANPGDVETSTITATSVGIPLASASSTVTTTAVRGIFSRWASVVPTVDGVLAPGEWAEAWNEDVFANVTFNDFTASVLVKNDATLLYVAVDAVGDLNQDADDMVSLSFDTDNDGSPTSQADDQFVIAGPGWGVPAVTEHFVYNAVSGNWIGEDSPFDVGLADHSALAGDWGFGTSDLSATAHRTYEFAIPLALLGLAPGDTTGFQLGRLGWPGGLFDWWNFAYDSWPLVGAFSLAQFGDLHLASGISATSLTVGSVDLAPATVVPGQADVEMLGLTLTADTSGDSMVTVDRVGVTLTGTPPTAGDIAAARLVHDLDGDGVSDPGETVLDSGVFGPTITFSGFSVLVAAGSPEELLVVYDIAAGATLGDTVGVLVASQTAIGVDISGEPDGVLPFGSLVSTASLITDPADVVTVATSNRAPGTAPQGAQDLVVLGIDFSVPLAGAAVIQGLTFQERGTSTDGDVDAVRLVLDADGSGSLTAGDTPVGAPGTLSGGQVAFSVSVPVVSPSTTRLLVVVDLAPAAVTGRTLILDLADETSVLISSPNTVAAFTGTDSGPTTITDVTAPMSSANPLATFQASRTFSLGYTATDNPGGSGVQSTEIWQRYNGGSWALVGTFTSSPQTITVIADGFYEYYAVSVDVAGNQEATPAGAQAYTTVGGTGGGTTGLVAGRVIDQAGNPVAGLTVTVVGTGATGTTDAQGAFSVANVPAGTHAVLFSGSGFTSRTMQGVQVNGGQTTTLNPVVVISTGGAVGGLAVLDWILIVIIVVLVVFLLMALLRRRKPQPEAMPPGLGMTPQAPPQFPQAPPTAPQAPPQDSGAPPTEPTTPPSSTEEEYPPPQA